MRILLALTLSLASILPVYAQEEPQSEPADILVIRPIHTGKFAIGISALEMILGRYRLMGSYGFNEQHSVELSAGAIQSNLFTYPLEDYWDSEDAEYPNYMRGFFLDAAHKYYVYRNSYDGFIFLRSSALYNQATLESMGKGWTTSDRDGITYYRYGDVEIDRTVKTLGARLELGWEMNEGAFFLDAMFGLAYEHLLSDPYHPAGFRPSIFSVEYEGFSPSLNLRMGLRLN